MPPRQTNPNSRWLGRVWYGVPVVVCAVAGLVISLAFHAQAIVVVAAPVTGAVIGVLIAAELGEWIVLIGGALNLDEDGPRFPRLRRFVQRFE